MGDRIGRRTAIRRMAGGAAAIHAGLPGWIGRAVGAEASPAAGRATIDVLLDEPIRDAAGRLAAISPLLHGHFVEHIGGVVYDGVWVGPDSPVPNYDGIRKGLVDSLRKIKAPLFRWPGGCFADRYHWRDGIGPRDRRPRRFGRWNEVTESNHFGTHEFMHFCRLLNAEPYFCANVGTGSAEEFQQWVEYCNAPAGALTVSDERAANGDADPFRVRYWAVGNENWGCGGTFTPEDYCTEYRKFVTWVPSYGVPWAMIGCGPSGNDLNWTRRFLKKWRDYPGAPMHAWAAHYYCGSSGTATDFTVDQWYDLIERGNHMEKLITDQWQAMGEFDPKHEVKLIVDEWGTWHPPDPRLSKHQYEQFNTMRDAIVCALTLDTFHRHADKLMMTNIAQLVNCLQALYMADGDRLVETVNYHVFAMYQPHQNATAIPVRVQAPACRFKRGEQQAEVFRVAGSASRQERTAWLTLAHTHNVEPIELGINLREGRIRHVSGTVLAHEELNAANTYEQPTKVMPRPMPVPLVGGDLRSVVITLPPASVTQLRIELG